MDVNSKQTLSPIANALVGALQAQEHTNQDQTISVNKFVSEIASWYEKLRNAMDYREEEVVLRAAIERILKRRLLLGGSGEKIAEPLVREILWARYFPDRSLSQSVIKKVETIIDLYLALKERILANKKNQEAELNIWIYQFISAEIANLLSKNTSKNIMSNFIFHIMKDSIQIQDDTEETKNVQVFLAVRRAFAKDDLAFMRFYLFQQIFGEIKQENIDQIAAGFPKAYAEIKKQISYKLKEKIYLYVKKKTPIFFILEDVFNSHKFDLKSFLATPDEFKKAVFKACEIRYKGISSKVRRAIIRSIIFLILTKAFFALSIEGTYEKIIYGKIAWRSIALNTGIPPALMIMASLFIKTPDRKNSERIFKSINIILFENNPKLDYGLTLTLQPKRSKPLLAAIFTFLWLAATLLSFVLIIFILRALQFNLVSQGIFLFFLTIVSFLSYRINTTAHVYTVEKRQSFFTPLFDFLFLPIVRVGMKLTEGIAQINVLIFIFDFLIEAPFKGLFGFFEQWFVYLHTKREELE